MFQVLVRRDQYLVPVRFSLIEKLTVLELGPSLFRSRVYFVGMEMSAERYRSALVEEHLHTEVSTARLAVACSRTESICALDTPGNHSKKSSTEAPSSRFSKSARTGTLVPRKTQEPLTLPGVRSTDGHDCHSIIASTVGFMVSRSRRVPIFVTARPVRCSLWFWSGAGRVVGCRPSRWFGSDLGTWKSTKNVAPRLPRLFSIRGGWSSTDCSSPAGWRRSSTK